MVDRCRTRPHVAAVQINRIHTDSTHLVTTMLLAAGCPAFTCTDGQPAQVQPQLPRDRQGDGADQRLHLGRVRALRAHDEPPGLHIV